MSGDVTVWGLVASLTLIGVALVVSAGRGLGLGRSILWATLRAAVQLLAVGLALAVTLESSRSLAISWVWIGFMIAFAALVVRQRVPEVPRATLLAATAMGASAVVSLTVLFGLGIFPLEARALIPMAGMVVGNSMTATVVASRRIVAELADKRDEVEARLALGQRGSTAAQPYVRSALRTALTPQIETTKAVGIVALPGAMTGLILAGVDPIDAVRVQAAVMYLILGSVATTVAVVALGLTRQLFTEDHRLVRLTRSE